jgi:hypothetical protein
MTPLQEAPHLLSAFRQLDAAGRVGLVRRMREQALRRLAGHTPPGFDAGNDDHCIVAALAIEAAAVPASVKAAARLLRACVHAVEAPGALDAAMLVSAYAALDEHAAEAGRKFHGKGKSPDAVGRWLDAALERTPKATTVELWAALTKKPPRGYVVEKDSFGGTLYRKEGWDTVLSYGDDKWRDRLRNARKRAKS